MSSPTRKKFCWGIIVPTRLKRYKDPETGLRIKQPNQEEKEESKKNGSNEASEIGSNFESSGYAASDNEVESDLESTARIEPKCKEMEDTCDSGVQPKPDSSYLFLLMLSDYPSPSASPICLMARSSSTKSWLWHQRLSHLNFDTINDLARNDLVAGLPKFKYHKEHLCPSCEQGKSKRASHPRKPVPNSRQRLHLLHIDLCGPMRIVSINGKR
nr:retrovirus-related Pol polyprotein from transposon TNT 1-94 [Tanacetum cinerariifolium]